VVLTRLDGSILGEVYAQNHSDRGWHDCACHLFGLASSGEFTIKFDNRVAAVGIRSARS